MPLIICAALYCNATYKTIISSANYTKIHNDFQFEDEYDHNQFMQSENAFNECKGKLELYPKTRQIISTEHAVCFVGVFAPGTDEEIVNKFTGQKYLVIKSSGGFGLAAIRLGKFILEKHINVVVMEYCLSACANWIFLTGKTKFVSDRSLVAWHGAPLEPNTREKLLDHSGILTEMYISSKSIFEKLTLDTRLMTTPDRSNLQYESWRSRIKSDGKSYWTWCPSRLRREFGVKNIIYYWYPDDISQLEDIARNLGLNLLVDPPPAD